MLLPAAALCRALDALDPFLFFSSPLISALPFCAIPKSNRDACAFGGPPFFLPSCRSRRGEGRDCLCWVAVTCPLLLLWPLLLRQRKKTSPVPNQNQPWLWDRGWDACLFSSCCFASLDCVLCSIKFRANDQESRAIPLLGTAITVLLNIGTRTKEEARGNSVGCAAPAAGVANQPRAQSLLSGALIEQNASPDVQRDTCSPLLSKSDWATGR
jgi:hypothetical protein